MLGFGQVHGHGHAPTGALSDMSGTIVQGAGRTFVDLSALFHLTDGPEFNGLADIGNLSALVWEPKHKLNYGHFGDF